MRNLNKLVMRHINFANRYPVQNEMHNSNPSKALPLYSTPQAEALEKQCPFNLGTTQALELINSTPALFEAYKLIAPFATYTKMSEDKYQFVYKANFIKELNTIELYIMDVDGFFRSYVNVDDFVPITSSDLDKKHFIRLPFMEFADTDLVFKRAYSREIYVFFKDGEWNAETANMEQFDFRNQFDEFKWIDDQIDMNA